MTLSLKKIFSDFEALCALRYEDDFSEGEMPSWDTAGPSRCRRWLSSIQFQMESSISSLLQKSFSYIMYTYIFISLYYIHITIYMFIFFMAVVSFVHVFKALPSAFLQPVGFELGQMRSGSSFGAES